MYRLKLGISVAICEETAEQKLRTMKELGFDSADIGLCGYRKEPEKERELILNAGKSLELVKSLGLFLNGIHVPFGHNWDFSSADEEKRQLAMNNFKNMLAVTDLYGPHCYVIHGSFEPIPVELREAQIVALQRSLSEMVMLTQTPIAVESLPRTCLFNTAKEGISIVDAVEGVRVCADVNHFLQEDSVDAVLALGSRIITTHISDHDYINEQHWMPGEGKIDWMRMLAALEKIGYDGVFNYELGNDPTEIKKNYDKLFAEYNAMALHT